jgi:hypothetical protein
MTRLDTATGSTDAVTGNTDTEPPGTEMGMTGTTTTTAIIVFPLASPPTGIRAEAIIAMDTRITRMTTTITITRKTSTTPAKANQRTFRC